MPALVPLFVDVGPQPQREPTGKSAFGLREIAGNARQIEGKIEPDKEAARLVGISIQLLDKPATRQQKQLRETFASDFRRMRNDIALKNLPFRRRQLISIKQAFFQASSTDDKSITAKLQILPLIGAGFCVEN